MRMRMPDRTGGGSSPGVLRGRTKHASGHRTSPAWTTARRLVGRTAGARAVAGIAAAIILAAGAVTLAYSGRATAAPAVHPVAIDAFEFHPAVVTVRQGDVVEWLNRDPVPHTATAKDAKLDSGDIAAGGKFRFTAKTKGRFAYICTLHPTMKGTLVVE